VSKTSRSKIEEEQENRNVKETEIIMKTNEGEEVGKKENRQRQQLFL
jgi:hypothetical protein